VGGSRPLLPLFLAHFFDGRVTTMADETDTATAAPPDDAAKPGEAANGETKPADDGKLKQTVEITDVGPCKKHVKITVDRDAIEERFKEKFDELLKDRTAAVPGFRPGKAPRTYIDRTFKPAFAEDVRSEVVVASLLQIAGNSKIASL